MAKQVAVITRIMNGVVDCSIVTSDAKKAEKIFLEQIRHEVKNFDKRNNAEDIEDILMEGYYEFGTGDVLRYPCDSGSVCLSWGEQK